MTDISYTNHIFKEGNMYVAYAPELDVSSCGTTVDEARENLKDAVKGFLESAESRGVLEEILQEAGYTPEDAQRAKWSAPELLLHEKAHLTLQHA